MTARQNHGNIFETYIKKHLNIDISHSWDIPPYPNCYNNEGISIKCLKKGGVIALGDAKTQYRIKNNFYFIIGFYEEFKNKNKKIIWLKEIYVSKQKWRELWGDITEQDIIILENLIIDKSKRNLSNQETKDFRKHIKENKKRILQNKNSIITLNPKIGKFKKHYEQRRLQCSISYKSFFTFFDINKIQPEVTIIGGKYIRLKDICLQS